VHVPGKVLPGVIKCKLRQYGHLLITSVPHTSCEKKINNTAKIIATVLHFPVPQFPVLHFPAPTFGPTNTGPAFFPALTFVPHFPVLRIPILYCQHPHCRYYTFVNVIAVKCYAVFTILGTKHFIVIGSAIWVIAFQQIWGLVFGLSVMRTSYYQKKPASITVANTRVQNTI